MCLIYRSFKHTTQTKGYYSVQFAICEIKCNGTEKHLYDCDVLQNCSQDNNCSQSVFIRCRKEI